MNHVNMLFERALVFLKWLGGSSACTQTRGLSIWGAQLARFVRK